MPELTKGQLDKAREEARWMGNGSCCEPQGYNNPNEVNGICPSCENPTVDGETYDKCGYSPVQCDLCGWAPCDLSC